VTRAYRTSAEAESAFYAALETADMAAMEAVWSSDESVVCIHPGAERIEGRLGVLASFAELFSSEPALRFRVIDTLHTGNASLAVHLVREEIALGGEVVSVMVATNIYQIESGGWRMLLHHASPEPELEFGEQFASTDAFEGGFDATFDGTFQDDDETESPLAPPVLH